MKYQPPGSEKIRALVEPYIAEGSYPAAYAFSKERLQALGPGVLQLLADFRDLIREEMNIADGDVPLEDSPWAAIRIKIRDKIWNLLELAPELLLLHDVQEQAIDKGAIPDPDEEESGMQYFRLPHWDFAHWACGTPIAVKSVARSIHIKGMRSGGTGAVRSTAVPYCPTCDKVPSAFGPPIYI